MTQWQKFSALLCGLSLLVVTGCVHSSVQRLGRMRLGQGTEGEAKVVAQIDPAAFEKVALITVETSGIATADRLVRHLQRRASLLGCDAITAIEHQDSESSGFCLRRREPMVSADTLQVVVSAPATLRRKAAASGAIGMALLRVIQQSDKRQGEAKAWPLRWYLKTYPNSPFKSDVEALFVTVASNQGSGGTPSNIRTAPQNR